MNKILAAVIVIFLIGCKKDTNSTNPANEAYYFPPNSGDTWETKSSLTTWDAAKLQEAFDFAGTKNTYGMLMLHNGKIVKEQYWNGWDKTNRYPLNSAYKSIVATVTGIAQQEGLLNINDRTSKYLGTGWTTAPLAKENLITIKHQLTMTTGLNENVPDDNCITPACLTYRADAGTSWYYYNAPYRLVQDVVAAASGKTFFNYSKEKLYDKIGINTAFTLNYILYCTTREAARFGSFILRKGEWNGTQILTDQNYFNAMTNTSQTYNLSYGYLWWLNGKASTMAPGSNLVFPVSLAPDAPKDMIMALGKDDKKIYVVPSLNIVVVRLGDNAGASVLGPSSFDNELWAKLKLALKY
jgi:CubicO group peptidase (beta-lactamase class C family)